jgi:uncharacterized protein
VSDWYEDSLDHIDDDADAEDDEQFDWDDGNVNHIANHNVAPYEAQEALLDRRRRGMTVNGSPTEERHGAISSTADGRILAIVFTLRGGKIRVVTARSATPTERRRYLR